MAMKDINDIQVIQAMLDSAALHHKTWPYELLMQRTGQPKKVCYRCMERACDRGYLEYGVSLRTGWVTREGFKVFYDYLNSPEVQKLREDFAKSGLSLLEFLQQREEPEWIKRCIAVSSRPPCCHKRIEATPERLI